jgi:uncharacterized membrane protein
MSWIIFVKFLHILAAIVMIGGGFARQVVRGIAKKSDDIHQIAFLTQAAGRIDRRLVIPGSDLVILFGIVLALMLKQPILGFLQGASRNWLLVANHLVIAILVVVFAIFVPYNRRLEPIIQSALVEGSVTPALRVALDDKVVKWAHHFEEAAGIVIVALMVFKPF